MMQLMLYSATIINSIVFLQMNHPLAMGLTLLIQTVLISLITGLMTKSFWFSYILFLIFLGGMLVLFMYVTSLASNEMFSLSAKLTTMSFIFFFFMMMTTMMMDNSYSYNPFINNEMMSISELNSYISNNSLNLSKLYNYPTNYVTILLINYLLITLIAVVKITNVFYGPLRPMK